MKDIELILQKENVSEIISDLKERSIYVPSWSVLLNDYEPELHRITNDKTGRRDKIHKDGHKDEAARIPLALEKLLTKRITEFTFAIPVKRIYYTSTDRQREIAAAIEKIYTAAHINAENIKRGIAYYASCEIFSLWYTKKTRHNLYGFPCDYKLKCKTFSPMDGTALYPLFDEKDDLVAMSYEYKKKVKDDWITYFETFTADKHFIWSSQADAEWDTVVDADPIVIEKIPAVYLFRHEPCWEGLQPIRNDLEYTISRNSDVIAYNSAPILKVAGTIIGNENKGETRRIYRVEEGGDVSYVSWAQSIESLKYHVDSLLKLFFMQAQMPDISFENLKSLGNIGYDARKTLLADAHLKIGEESGPWTEFLEREGNVIKAFLKKMNTTWSSNDIDAVTIEHVITPFIQEDEMNEIKKWQLANGGKALISHRESIQAANLTEDPDKTYEEVINEEMNESLKGQSDLASMINAL